MNHRCMASRLCSFTALCITLTLTLTLTLRIPKAVGKPVTKMFLAPDDDRRAPPLLCFICGLQFATDFCPECEAPLRP